MNTELKEKTEQKQIKCQTQQQPFSRLTQPRARAQAEAVVATKPATDSCRISKCTSNYRTYWSSCRKQGATINKIKDTTRTRISHLDPDPGNGHLFHSFHISGTPQGVDRARRWILKILGNTYRADHPEDFSEEGAPEDSGDSPTEEASHNYITFIIKIFTLNFFIFTNKSIIYNLYIKLNLKRQKLKKLIHNI